MKGELECEGKVQFGPLPWDLSEKLAHFSGNWLEFSAPENAIVVRKSLPVGCPATTAVSCELITMLESIPSEARLAMPGGEIFVRSEAGRIMRFAVERGEVRIQWPEEDYSRPIPVAADSVLKGLDASATKIRGWARFAGSRGIEIRAFAERFGGLYPERDLPSECEQNVAYIPFRDVHIEPDELVRRLMDLADPLESLQAELEITSTSPRSADRDFRVLIRDGKVEAQRPTIWK